LGKLILRYKKYETIFYIGEPLEYASSRAQG